MLLMPLEWEDISDSFLTLPLHGWRQGYKALYSAASAQPCASSYDLCTNPVAHILPTNLVNFYFPLGDRTITDAILSSEQQYNVYVLFQLSTVTSTGRAVVSSLFARAPLSADNIVTMCEEVTVGASLLSTTKVDVAVGFVGTQPSWGSSMVIWPDVTQAAPAGGALVDTSKNYTAPSIQQALITVVLKGSPSIFSKVSASNFYLDVEQLSVIHFLDTARFNSVVSLIRSGAAYSISSAPGTGRPVMSFSSNVTRICGAEANTLSCALYTNIYGRTVTRPSAAHGMATGINTTSLDATRDWLMANILRGTDEYSTSLAANMTSLVRKNFGIDDRVRKAWFVNPGNRWVLVHRRCAVFVFRNSRRVRGTFAGGPYP